MDFIEDLNSKIAKGEIDKVLAQLRSLFSGSPKLNEVILQTSRYSDLKDQIRKGIIDYSTSSISKNKITLAILELVNELNDCVESDPSLKTEFPIESKQAKIIQNHSGSGDNIAGDKIVKS